MTVVLGSLFGGLWVGDTHKQIMMYEDKLYSRYNIQEDLYQISFILDLSLLSLVYHMPSLHASPSVHAC